MSDIGIFSFNGNKIITTGGGGAVITNKKNLAKKIRHLASTAKIKHKWEYIHDDIGYNCFSNVLRHRVSSHRTNLVIGDCPFDARGVDSLQLQKLMRAAFSSP